MFVFVNEVHVLTRTHAKLVFLLAASNLPWELDVAMLRRLEKRILVPLPSAGAREVMFKKMLGPRMAGGCSGEEEASGLNAKELAKGTEGYSGSDIKAVCKEAAMRPLRRLISKLDLVNTKRAAPVNNDLVKLDPVLQEDITASLTCVRKSQSLPYARYERWRNEFGSETS